MKADTDTDEPRTTTIRAVSLQTGLSEQTVRKMIREGQLRVSRLRRRILIHADSVSEFLEAHAG